MTKRNPARTPAKTKPSRVRWIGVGAGLLLVAAAAWLLFGRTAGPRSAKEADLANLIPPGSAEGFNLLLVTLDTVRGDRLGTYGYEAAETPRIDGLVERGVRFDDATAPAPVTLPSHATMMTGLYPPNHGVRDNGLFRLKDEHVTLAERLRERGYETAAFVGCFVLDQRYGLNQGFEVYDFEVDQQGFQPSNFDFNQRSAGTVTEAAIGWLQKREDDRPFFLWTHYFDAHVPYQSPLGKLARFAERGYDAEIAYVDQELGRLLDELDRLKLRDRTLIALVSDHGEGLNEHGESTHGLFVYDSTMRVAFILSSPGLFRGPHFVGDRIVSLADLRPTLEDLLGLPLETPMDGHSLVREAADPNRSVYIETKMPFHAARCSPLYGLRRKHDKYVEAPEPEYYDLKADPGELKNLFSTGHEESKQLALELRELRKTWPNPEGEEAPSSMTPEETERLRSLGYVQIAGATESASLPDPKAMMRASRMLASAHRLQRERRTEEALRSAREAVQECPGYPDATALVAQLCIELDRPEEAIQALQESLRLNPIAGMALQLAQTYLGLRRFQEMEEALAMAARMEPDNGFIHVMRGDRFNIEGRIPEARAEYEKAIEVDEHRVGVLVRPILADLKNRDRSTGGAQ